MNARSQCGCCGRVRREWRQWKRAPGKPIESALKPETRKQRQQHADVWEERKAQLIARDEARRAGDQEAPQTA